MTAGQIRKLLKGVPKDMVVLIGIGDSLENICPVSSQPVLLKDEDSDEKEMVFVLSECTCEDEIDAQEELIETYINPN